MTTIEAGPTIGTTARIGILAGTGRLPPLLAQAMLLNDHKPFVVNLTNESPLWLQRLPHADIPVTQLSNIFAALRVAHVSTVILAGGINARPKFSDFLYDWRMYGEFLHLFRALRRGDDGLLRAAVALIERNGFTVIGAHEVAPSLLATEAILTRRQPTTIDHQDITLAINEAREHGRLDLGQAVVVRSGNVMTKEDRAGTAAMLKKLISDVVLPSSGVLVKLSKPNQELRVDLPSIGPDTVIQARDAGLSGIVVEAGRALILDRDEVVRLADVNNLFVAGVRSER